MKRAALAGWLAAAVLAFHARVLFTADYALPWDLRNYHLPLATALADALAEGEFPYWEPYSYCGRPLAANPQAAVFYPTVALAAALGDRAGLLNRLEWNTVLHVFLAGWFALRLARRLGAGEAGALASGLLYSLGGFFASQAQHMGSVMAAAWLPLAWEAALAACGWRLLLACLLSIFAGFTPMTIVVLATAAAWVVSRRWWAGFGWIAAAAGLAAVQLGPAFDLMNESVARYRTDWLGHGGGLPPQSLVSLVWPNYYGNFDLASYRAPFELTFLHLFCGWLGLALAVWGARRRPWLGGLAVVFLALMLGESTPLGAAVFTVLPQFLQRSLYWYPFLAPFTLSLALLAALAVPDRRWWLAVPLAAELILVSSGRPMNTQSLAREPGVTATSIDGSAETLDAVRRLAGTGRIDTMGDSMAWSTGAPVMRLRAANGYDPLALEYLIQARLRMARGERWGAYYEIETPNAGALRALGVTVVMSRRRLDPLPAPLALAAELPGRFAYRVKEPAPRIEWPGALRIVEDSRHRLRVDVDHDRAASLTVHDAWSAGWRASIDGRPVTVDRVLDAFRRVEVPAGRHQVIIEIDRWRFWRWSLLSGATLVAVLAALWLRKNDRGQTPRRPAP